MTKTIVADIMSTKLKVLYDDQSLLDGHNLMRDSGIRHIPILARESNTLLGVVGQKAMLTRIISIVSTFGTNRLERRESQVPVTELMDEDNPTVNANTSLIEAGKHFIERKFGCLPVLDDNGQIIGIVSSSDYVKLSIELLEARETNT